jgi:hypothetical protein
MRWIGWIASALLCLLVACSGAPADGMREMRRVAVVPVSGQTLELARVGQLPFGNRRHKLDVGDWNLRDEAYRAVKDLLERGGRYRVSRLDASPEVFPALHEAAGPGACRARDARKELARLAASCACDAMLLIVDDRRQLETDESQYFRGFSWVARAGITGSEVRASEAVVALRAVLVDARTHKVIAERRNDEPLGYPGLPRGPVDVRWWPPDMEDVGDAQRAHLEPVFVSLMRDTVRRAVQGTGLLSRS